MLDRGSPQGRGGGSQSAPPFPESASGSAEPCPLKARAILRFVEELAKQVFALGGRIVHESLPDIRVPHLEVARARKAERSRMENLGLFVSRWFFKEPTEDDIDFDVWKVYVVTMAPKTRRRPVRSRANRMPPCCRRA